MLDGQWGAPLPTEHSKITIVHGIGCSLNLSISYYCSFVFWEYGCGLSSVGKQSIDKLCLMSGHLLLQKARTFGLGSPRPPRVSITLEVLQHCGNRNLWSEWKDATHGWGTPRGSTKALRCTEGAPTSAFPQGTPLWSSRGQIVFPKPQQHWNQSTTAVHSPSIESCTWYSWTCKAWNKQAGSSSFCWPKRWVFFHSHPFSRSPPLDDPDKSVLFWGCTTYNVHFWNIDRTSSWIECLCFCSLIAGNSATARVSASKCTNPWYISEGTEAIFLDAFSQFVDNRRWERRLTKMPGIRNRKLKTCLQRLGIRLSNSSRASFFNAKSFSRKTVWPVKGTGSWMLWFQKGLQPMQCRFRRS